MIIIVINTCIFILNELGQLPSVTGPSSTFILGSKAVVMLLLTFCLLLLPLWESVILLCYVVRYFMSILMGTRELNALLSLFSSCLVIFVWLFLAVPWVYLQFAIVVFSDHIHLIVLE